MREELTTAFAEGRGVTAKVRWVSKGDEQGRNKWIHCTPLLGLSGQIGVWMVVIVDDEKSNDRWRRGRRLPPHIATPEGTLERSWSSAHSTYVIGHRVGGSSQHGSGDLNGTRPATRAGGGSLGSGSGSMTSLKIT